MAGKTKIRQSGKRNSEGGNFAPPILRAVWANVSPLLDARPAGALTSTEIAQQAGVSRDVIRKQLRQFRAEGVLHEARVRAQCEDGKNENHAATIADVPILNFSTIL